MSENKKIKLCKTCGEEIAKSAKVCPKCGAKNKKPIFKRVWFWVIIVSVGLIAVAGSGDEKPQPGSIITETEKTTSVTTQKSTVKEDEKEQESTTKVEKTKKEFKKSDYSKDITYDDLSRTPDNYEGKKVCMTGEVLQVLEGDNETDLRVAINEDYNDVAYIVYSSDIIDKRVLENDIVTFYGTSKNLYSYESTLGGEITIPLLVVDKIVIKNEN